MGCLIETQTYLDYDYGYETTRHLSMFFSCLYHSLSALIYSPTAAPLAHRVTPYLPSRMVLVTATSYMVATVEFILPGCHDSFANHEKLRYLLYAI